jgi:AraC-like DNA-binding protein
MPLSLYSAVDLLMRGGVVALLSMMALLLLRDYGRVAAARLGAIFAAGAIAFALCSSADLHGHFGGLGAVIVAIATGNNAIFWLFARALFDDSFSPRPWHWALWLAIMAASVLCCTLPEPSGVIEATITRALFTGQAVLFALLALGQVLATWRNDLVEQRRRLRLFIVVAAAAQTLVTAAAGIAGDPQRPTMTGLWQVAVMLGMVAIVAWSLLRTSGEQLFFMPSGLPTTDSQPNVPVGQRSLDADDRPLVAALERSMVVERLYRQEGLTIGQLAQRQGLPEYRLRRLINQGLGYRNFAAFLNGYRLADAKQALADPAQVEVPILTIALDAGFSSLGPFNRAFKAETGLTPSDFRRRALGELAVSGIGRPVPDSASRISNTA